MEDLKARHESPPVAVSPWSSIYTWWIVKFALKARKCGIFQKDLWDPPSDMTCDTSSKTLQMIRKCGLPENASAWETQYFYMKLAIQSSPSHVSAIICVATIFNVCNIGCLLLIDLLLKAKVAKENSLTIYASLICTATIINVIVLFAKNYLSSRMGNKLKSAYTALILSKILSLTEYDLSHVPVAYITNLVSTDVDIIFLGYCCMADIYYISITLISSILACWYLVGWVCIVAFGVMIVQFAVQSLLMKQYTHIRQHLCKYSDQRMTIMSNVLRGMKTIKMNAWETAFEHKINTIRNSELSFIWKSNLLRSLNTAMFIILPKASTLLTLTACININSNFPTTQIFPFNGVTIILSQAMGLCLPHLLNSNIDAHVAIKRIEKFLRTETVESNFKKENKTSKSAKIYIQSVCCSWEKEQEHGLLNDVAFEAKVGDLIAIVGKVGCGKSTLLKTILGEIPLQSGKIRLQGSVAYVPQEPWIFSSTIQKNITFGLDFNSQKLKQALDISALDEDIKSFPNGLQQCVGERGLRLSGGQKARLGLARAIYADADIYILDDPFSAVDANIGKLIYEKCIIEFMKNKICILATHQIHLLQNSTSIITISKGHAIIQYGTDRIIQDNCITKLGKSSNVTEKSNEQMDAEHEDLHPNKNANSNLYCKYFSNSNVFHITFTVTMLLILIASLCGYLTWLQIWINNEVENLVKTDIFKFNSTSHSTWSENKQILPRNFCFIIFAVLSIAVILAVICTLFLLAQLCHKSSEIIHRNLLKSVLFSKMKIFESQQMGTLINRFSLDLKKVDYDIPQHMIIFIPEICNTMAYIVLTIMGNYWLAIPLLVLGIFQHYIFQIIFKLVRESMSVESEARSGFYTKLQNTISGLSLIKAYRKEKIIKKELQHNMNACTSARFLKETFNLCGIQAVQLTSAVYLISSVLFMVYMKDSDIGTIGGSLASSFALLQTALWANIEFGYFDSEMPCLQRIFQCSKLEQESFLHCKEKPKNNWPSTGDILCQDLSLSYSENGRKVLNNLNFRIKSGEKVGIVGRTGAGKSSLFDAIYRLHESTGKINIDGINLSEIGVHDFRPCLSIILQEPTLFYGTIRTNIDPLNKCKDEDVWGALDKVHMRNVIAKQDKGLQGEVAEGGANFSTGQRQLLCLARTLLRNNKILMLDEATANIDNNTDTIIQQTIRKHFKECTVITIAHRLHTVLDADRIMVLQDGNIVEFDQPAKLLQDENSMLFQLNSKYEN